MSSVTTSPEFLINMKSIPKKGDSDYEAFIGEEIDKLKYGVTINGVKISNWLYWHLNYWKIFRPVEDRRSGEVIDQFLNPQLRDNEWLIAEKLEQAKQEKKGVIIVGTRRFSKSTISSSYIGLHASIREGSQNVIVGNNKPDLTNITIQLDKGLANVPKFIKYDRLLDDWRKEVALGYKEKKVGGDRYEWSRIFVRNTQDGNQTEILAGLTPTSLLYDEIGKAPIKEAFLASIPSFASPYGWRTVPLLLGTGRRFYNGTRC